MLYIAICEDELAIGSRLEELIYKQAEIKNVQIDIEVFLTAEECLAYIKQNHFFDLLFLDIELRNMNGIELADLIRNDLRDDYMQIVYISAKESYAMKLFETQPLNFLVKPISEEKLAKVFSKAIKILDNKEKMFCYKKGHVQKRVLKNIYEELKIYNFFLCHKSFLINYEKVKIFESNRLIMENEDMLPISQAQRKTVKEFQLEMEIRNL